MAKSSAPPAQPPLSFPQHQEAQLEGLLVAAGFPAPTIAAAGGVGGFIQKFLDFLAAHPFISKLLVGFLNKWLTGNGLPPLPTP